MIPPLLVVGRLARAHGVRGEVAVQLLTEVESRFEPGSELLLGPAGERRLTVKAARPHHGRLLVTFEGIDDRTKAEALGGLFLMVPREDAPSLPEGRYWIHELVGLEVRHEDGRVLGRLLDVVANPANDLWVVDAGDREVLIPALKEVIVGIDLEAGTATIRELPGLLD